MNATERMLPLYEAKMVHLFDAYWATYEADGSARYLTDDEKRRGVLPMPRYWVREIELNARLADWDQSWLLGWRDITNNTNERTAIANITPRVGTGDTFLLALPNISPAQAACLCAVFNSFVFDYSARQKIGGTHLKFFTFKQLPVPPPNRFDEPCPWQPEQSLSAWIAPRVAELVATAVDLQRFATALGFPQAPFRWDPARRELLRAELDAAFFHLYGLSREELEHVMDTFPIVRKHDEQAHGEYRSKTLIVQRYDAMAAAIAQSARYTSPLAAAATTSEKP